MNDRIRDEMMSLLTSKEAWSRRDFVAGSLATGFALAVQPVCAQTMIETDTKGINTGEVRVPTRDRSIPAYVALPEKGHDFPLILVVQEIFGVHEHIRDVCRRLAKSGYVAIAPELYVRQGNVAKIQDIKEIISDVVSKASDDQVMSDLDATVAWARGLNMAHKSKLGITGFCWGGRIVWMYTAHNPQVKAAVAWYGPVARNYHAGDKTALDVVGQVNAPVLGLYGGADPGIPNDTVDKMRAALKAAGKKSEIVTYPDTPHGFHADYRPSYRKEQATDGWKRALAWFKQNGVA